MVGNLGETPGHRAHVRIGLLADHSSNVADEPGRGDLPKASRRRNRSPVNLTASVKSKVGSLVVAGFLYSLYSIHLYRRDRNWQEPLVRYVENRPSWKKLALNDIRNLGREVFRKLMKRRTRIIFIELLFIEWYC